MSTGFLVTLGLAVATIIGVRILFLVCAWVGRPPSGSLNTSRRTLTVMALAFVSVGLTMFDGGPLDQHLLTIFVAVVALATWMATMVRLPTRGNAAPGQEGPGRC